MTLSSEPIEDDSFPYSAAIYAASKKYLLDPKLVASIILQESGGDPDASRVEDGWYDRNMAKKGRKDLSGYVPWPLPTLATEKRYRSTSYGLMQVLGETARAMGHRGKWLNKIDDVETNLELGCRYLAHLFEIVLRRNSLTSTADPLAVKLVLKSYNGSWDYPPLVLARLERKEFEQILAPQHQA